MAWLIKFLAINIVRSSQTKINIAKTMFSTSQQQHRPEFPPSKNELPFGENNSCPEVAVGFTREPKTRTSGKFNKGEGKHEKYKPLFYTSQNPLFEELFKGYAFADKTLFLTKLLNTEEPIRITLPRAMGKTMLLKMVEYFCDCAQERGSARPKDGLEEAWHHTAIWQEDKEFFNQHFGKHPTIFFTMGNVNGNTLEEVLHGFRYQLANTCKKFRYIYEALNKEYNSLEKSSKECLAYTFLHNALSGGKQFNKTDLSGSLRKLAGIVKWFHGDAETVLLVDRYHKPASSALFCGKYADPKEIAAIYKFHEHFLLSTFKGNTAVTHSMLAGILQTGKEYALRFTECNLMSGSALNEFFGFTRKEIHEMCAAIKKKCGICIPDSVQKLLWAWFNESYMYGNERYYFCNPYVCCCFLNRYIESFSGIPVIQNDLPIGGLVNILHPLFQNEKFLKQLNSIVEYDEHDEEKKKRVPKINAILLKTEFFLSDYRRIVEVLGAPAQLDNECLRMVMSYLCQIGVLAIDRDRLVVPNQQIRMEWMILLTPYYKHLFAFSDSLAQNAAVALQKIARKQSFANKDFQKEFKEFKKAFTAFLFGTNAEYQSEFSSHSLLFYLASKIYTKHVIPDDGHTCQNGEKLRIELSFVLNNVTIIIEVKSPMGKTVEEALKEAVYYRKVYDEIASDHKKFDRFIYIGIKVADMEGKKVQMCYRIEDGKKPQPDFITSKENSHNNTTHQKLSSAESLELKKGADYLDV